MQWLSLRWRRAVVTVSDLWEIFCTRQRSDSLPKRWRWLMKARHLSKQCHPPPFLEVQALFWAKGSLHNSFQQEPHRKLLACTITDNVWWKVSVSRDWQSCDVVELSSIEQYACSAMWVHWNCSLDRSTSRCPQHPPPPFAAALWHSVWHGSWY